LISEKGQEPKNLHLVATIATNIHEKRVGLLNQTLQLVELGFISSRRVEQIKILGLEEKEKKAKK
jgi:hypothetical protein